jgi:dUTP diphosphatase
MKQSPKIRLPISVNDEKLIPHYASFEASGADLKAAIKDDVIIMPFESKLIPTGIKVAIPEGYEIQIRPRSGLAFKFQITVLNTPGTIDADYRGEIGVILINHGKNDFVVKPYMRIAQLILAPVVQADFQISESLTITARNEGGFGHTGI